MAEESRIAVFVDFENLAIGSRDMHAGEFRIDLVQKRLLEKGRIVFKRAYCDWNRYRGAVRDFHAQGIEMIDIPSNRMSGKNSADIRMVVDALDLCHSKGHIDIFALLTGDSDFSPLVNKLKENNKRVIGCGVKSSTSDLLVSSCDEFLYYDDLVRTADKQKRVTVARTTAAKSARPTRGRGRAPMKVGAARFEEAGEVTTELPAGAAVPDVPVETGELLPQVVEAIETATAEEPAAPAKPARGRGRTPRKTKAQLKAEAEAEAEAAVEAAPEPEEANDPKAEGIEMLMAIVASLAQDYDPVWGSLVKQTLRRVHPDFREERYGYASFVEMLKDAETRGLVTLEYDTARGNYKIRVKS